MDFGFPNFGFLALNAVTDPESELRNPKFEIRNGPRGVSKRDGWPAVNMVSQDRLKSAKPPAFVDTPDARFIELEIGGGR